MYVIGNTVTYTIVRPKLTADEVAENVTQVRYTDPDGVYDYISVTSVDPTTTLPGSCTFSHALSKTGVWRFEIMTGTAGVGGKVVHVIHTNVVDIDTTYEATVKFED